MAAVCVFCGSQTGVNPESRNAARRFGQELAARGHSLIYGGGSTGIMGLLADSMLAAGGHVIGVIPRHLARPELMHDRVADMRITADMHERKATMHQLADAYVALPGGFGTLEELFEAVTWAQLELHSRPAAVLNTNGVYDGLVTMLDTMTTQEFLSKSCRQLLTTATSVSELMQWLDGRFPEQSLSLGGRFAILRHDHPFLHWDLLLEHPEHGTALTWRLMSEPATDGSIQAQRIGDHRLHYLTWEGPVSGDRGSVQRIAEGTYAGQLRADGTAGVLFRDTNIAAGAFLSGDSSEQSCWTFYGQCSVKP